MSTSHKPNSFCFPKGGQAVDRQRALYEAQENHRRKEPMTILFSQAVELFKETKRAERYSEHTLLDYSNTYRRFMKYLGNDREWSWQPTQLTAIDVLTITRFMANVTDVSDK